MLDLYSYYILVLQYDFFKKHTVFVALFLKLYFAKSFKALLRIKFAA